MGGVLVGLGEVHVLDAGDENRIWVRAGCIRVVVTLK